jgi:hypothetical protein
VVEGRQATATIDLVSSRLPDICTTATIAGHGVNLLDQRIVQVDMHTYVYSLSSRAASSQAVDAHMLAL